MISIHANNVPFHTLRIGTVVEEAPLYKEHTDIGHIVGFDRSSEGDLMLVVKFSKKKDPYPIHPANVRVWIEN